MRSSGSVASEATWSAEAPGNEKNTSTIGTSICGSSCRGVKMKPSTPTIRQAMRNSSVSGEWMKARVIEPASPVVCAGSAPLPLLLALLSDTVCSPRVRE